MEEILPHIPREYTALAEWLACIIYLWPLTKKIKNYNWTIILVLMGLGQLFLQIAAGQLPLIYWVFGMLINICWMFLTLFFIADIKLKHAVYLCCKAFIVAEFVASLAWQIYCHLIWNRIETRSVFITLFMLLIYTLIFSVIFYIEKKFTDKDMNKIINFKEVLTLIFMVTIIFAMSNVGFLLYSTTFQFGDYLSIFLVRTLVNFSGLCMIYLQQSQKHEHYLRKEINAINNVLYNQYEQYIAFKESSEILNRKCHDLKHQVDIIRSESNKETRDKYLEDMVVEINRIGAKITTGNAVLDTILTRKNQYCLNHQISFTCLVDGKHLDFIDVMDICSIFGNALDNAIESVRKNKNTEQRLINLRVFEKDKFIMIRLENYCENEIKLIEGLPPTTKTDKTSHGYGIKSIKYITSKYNGNLTIDIKDNWFRLKILLPYPKH